MKEVIIIGGGASGLIAAITAARRGADVCIIERLSRVGKKILVTGNGRCNLTNIDLASNYYHSSSNSSLGDVLEAFGVEECLTFFEELGIMPLIEGNKVYPLSEQATSIVDVLRMELERLEVEMKVDTKITQLEKDSKGFKLTSETGEVFRAKQVIVATGGMANQSLGCDGLGYRLLKSLGHTLEPPFPILVHLISPSPYCKMMKGTKIKALATISVEGEVKRKEYGEVLFTEDGLSGPPIFQISRVASLAALHKKRCSVSLDLFPKLEKEAMITLLYERIARHPERTIEMLLLGMLHKRMIIPLLKFAQIQSIHRTVESLEYDEINRLVEAIKAFQFKVEGTRGFKFAQVTAGGIQVEEIDLKTMASHKVKDLYITGEIMDVDGDCGGYNLQWAWATGVIAGRSIRVKG